MILKTKLFGRLYEFKSVKEVLAKANEYKSGDQLAGVAAESAEERVAAKVVLAQLKLSDLFNNPKHPYTRSLLNSIPQLDTETEKLHVIQGIVPSLTKLTRTGCRFSQRIPWIKESEHEKNPILHEVEKEHFVRCTCWKNFHFEK